MTIDVLPDDALLEIFTFCLVEESPLTWSHVETWHTLVHVCPRWRTIILASPRHLDLRIRCTARTPVKEMLDIWPALPLVIWREPNTPLQEEDADNMTAALGHNNRVYQIVLDHLPGSLSERLATVIQESFPALTYLQISVVDMSNPVFPEAFLGGSAQRLRSCIIGGIAIPGIRKLLLSAGSLVTLHLWNVPHSGYVSPEEIVTCLYPMHNLEDLAIGFESPLSRPDRPSRPSYPGTRVVLPTLARFHFRGVSEYMEDLISRIDVPLLDDIKIVFFNQLIFVTPQLHNFLARTEKFKELNHATVEFFSRHVALRLESVPLSLEVSCRKLDWQLSSMGQVCNSISPLFSTLERLDIRDGGLSGSRWQDDMENNQLLEFFHPFTALKDLYLDKKFAPLVAPALQDLVGERGTEVLSALQNVLVADLQPWGSVRRALGQFAAARGLSGRPVVVFSWDGRS